MNAIPHRRILALDVHALHAGFAVLEGPRRLVGHGRIHYGSISGVPAIRVARLIDLYRPDRIVLTMPANQTLAGERLAAASTSIAGEAARRRIPIRRIGRWQALDILGARTRYAAALHVSETLPALGARLPRRRKMWQSEQPIMSVFDAAAAALAYYGRYARRDRHGDLLAA